MKVARVIAIVAMPGVQLLDVSGPLDVFAEANVQARKDVYRLLIVAKTAGHIRSSSGVRLVPDLAIGDAMGVKIDTLLVAGCPNAADVRPDVAVVEWLRRIAPRARRYGSVCSGAFLLAATGLIDGRRVTTHWAVAQQWQRYSAFISLVSSPGLFGVASICSSFQPGLAVFRLGSIGPCCCSSRATFLTCATAKPIV